MATRGESCVLPVGLRVLDVRLARSRTAQSGRGDAPRPAPGRGLRVVPRSGHRRRARGDSVAARRDAKDATTSRRSKPFIAAMNRHQILPIWDLCHYGYPDDVDPFEPDFGERFAAYARAAAEYVVPRVRGPHFFTPINEITFFGFMGGRSGVGRLPSEHERGPARVSPLPVRRRHRGRQGDSRCRSRARMVHIDPLVLVVPPKDRPDLADEGGARDGSRTPSTPGT